jgi:hypothetical protein
MSNANLPTHWSSWAIIGAIVFLVLLATQHTATAFAGLTFIGIIFILVVLADSSFSSGFFWVVLIGLVVLLLILCLRYVPDEWKPQQTLAVSTQSLSLLLLSLVI